MNIVLGPVPCHECSLPLAWDGASWRERDGGAHGCSRVLCMTPAEWAAWDSANRLVQPQIRSGRPCVDCNATFAATMRAIWRCNGTPGRQGRGPDKGPRRVAA